MRLNHFLAFGVLLSLEHNAFITRLLSIWATAANRLSRLDSQLFLWLFLEVSLEKRGGSVSHHFFMFNLSIVLYRMQPSNLPVPPLVLKMLVPWFNAL
jgi:hypothetical protein